MITTIDAVLHLGIGATTVIPDVDAELQLTGLWLERVTIGGVTITGNEIAAHRDPLSIAIWNAATGWVDCNAMLIEEAEYEQSLARKEMNYERQREYAA